MEPVSQTLRLFPQVARMQDDISMPQSDGSSCIRLVDKPWLPSIRFALFGAAGPYLQSRIKALATDMPKQSVKINCRLATGTVIGRYRFSADRTC